RCHLADVVDHLRRLQPRRDHRQEQGRHLVLGHGERVARVEDLAVHREPGVRDQGDVAVNQRVVLTVDMDVESGRGERVAVPHGVHPHARVGEPLGDGRVRPQLQAGVTAQRRAHGVGIHVVGVLMGDQDGAGAAQRRVGIAPGTGVDDQGRPVLVQPDAGVPQLGHPHLQLLSRSVRGCPLCGDHTSAVLARAGRMASSRCPGTPQGRLEAWRIQMTAQAGGSGLAATSARTATPEPLYGGRAPRRVTVRDIAAAKSRGERWPMLTAYDALIARVFDEAGIPVLLVGDSAGMVVFGHDTTIPVTVDDLIPLTAAVVRGTSRAMVVADLPFGSYQGSPEAALAAATRFLKEAGRTRSSWRAGTGCSGRSRTWWRPGSRSWPTWA